MVFHRTRKSFSCLILHSPAPSSLSLLLFSFFFFFLFSSLSLFLELLSPLKRERERKINRVRERDKCDEANELGNKFCWRLMVQEKRAKMLSVQCHILTVRMHRFFLPLSPLFACSQSSASVVVDVWAVCAAACHAGGPGSITSPSRTSV
jgi:hypothetical protein